MNLRDQLVEFIGEWNLELVCALEANTSLIQSGLFDSLALLNLAEWIEQKIGCPLDLIALNLVDECDTIDDILAFIEKHRIDNNSSTLPPLPQPAPLAGA